MNACLITRGAPSRYIGARIALRREPVWYALGGCVAGPFADDPPVGCSRRYDAHERLDFVVDSWSWRAHLGPRAACVVE